MRHTSVRFPQRLYSDAKHAQKERGLETFSDLVQQAVRDLLYRDDLAGMEKRIARSHERLVQRMKRLADGNRASFALMMALAREILSERNTPVTVQQRLYRVLANAMDDYRGPMKTFFENAGVVVEEESDDTAIAGEMEPFAPEDEYGDDGNQ